MVFISTVRIWKVMHEERKKGDITLHKNLSESWNQAWATFVGALTTASMLAHSYQNCIVPR